MYICTYLNVLWCNVLSFFVYVIIWVLKILDNTLNDLEKSLYLLFFSYFKSMWEVVCFPWHIAIFVTYFVDNKQLYVDDPS